MRTTFQSAPYPAVSRTTRPPACTRGLQQICRWGRGKDSVLSVLHGVLPVLHGVLSVLHGVLSVLHRRYLSSASTAYRGCTVFGRHCNQRVIGFVSGFLQGLTCSSGGGLRCVSGGSSCTLRGGGIGRAGGEVRWGEGKGGCLRGGGGRLTLLAASAFPGFHTPPGGLSSA